MARQVRYVAPPGTKRCPKCHLFKPISDFNGAYCSGCYRKYHRDWARTTRPETVERMKREAMEHYGGKCERCGETNINVLFLDPPGNGQLELLYKLRKENYPAGYRILCANCKILENLGYSE